MKRTIALLVAFVVAPAAMAEPVEPPEGYLGTTLEIEVEAFQALSKAMNQIVQDKEVKVSKRASVAHNRAGDLYEHAKDLADDHHDKAAYKKLREAWKAHSPATAEFMDKADPEQIRAVAGVFIDTIGDHLGAMDAVAGQGGTEAVAHLEAARTLKAQANTLLDQGDERGALRVATDALSELDQCLRATWKASR
jgi:hypothetical protein